MYGLQAFFSILSLCKALVCPESSIMLMDCKMKNVSFWNAFSVKRATVFHCNVLTKIGRDTESLTFKYGSKSFAEMRQITVRV